MNKIFRVLSNEKSEILSIGYLISEDEKSFKIRIQNGIKTSVQSFKKENFKLKSIYEQGTKEMYQIKTKDHNNNDILIELPKSCFGGCG